MATAPVSEISATGSDPAARLRRIAAAVRVHFTWWGTHRSLTDTQKEEVGAAYSADTRFLTAGKKIIDVRHEAFRKLTSLRSQIARYWKSCTLPYTEPGVPLLRQAEVEGFVHRMEDLRQQLLQAETELNAVYEQMKSDARQQLGRLYDPDDYPPEVCGLFDVTWEFPSVDPPSYLMRLSPDLYQQEQERVSRRFEEAVQLAEQAFLSEFGKLIAHLTERLGSDVTGDRKVFRDSAITNLAEFFERFRHLNVRSNADLDQLVEQAQQVVRGIGPQDLRDNDTLRQQVAGQMAVVQSELDGLLVNRPRRQIVRSQVNRNGDAHVSAD